MRHYCPPELLDDLLEVLAEVRTWSRVVEQQPGIFYVGRDPFRHFHLLANGQRRADIKGGNGWAQLDLPRPAAAARRRALLRVLRARHREKSPGTGLGRRGGAVRPSARGMVEGRLSPPILIT